MTMAPQARFQAPRGLAMPKWARGVAEVEQLVARGDLERVSGAAADGTPLLEQARKTAATAAGLVSSDAYSAYVLAYDAARFACIALLAQQGLRATTSGGHYAVEQAVRAQFGDGFRPFGAFRRRRNELEYPHLPSDTATSEEAEQAAATAQRLIAAAGKLLPQLFFFSQDQELLGPPLERGIGSCPHVASLFGSSRRRMLSLGGLGQSGAASLRAVTLAGESFTPSLIHEHYRRLPHVRLYNEYRPAENAVCSTVQSLGASDDRVLIGHPIDNTAAFVLGSTGEPIGPGQVGELDLSGVGLAEATWVIRN
jgi:hypothetical protein